MAEKLGDDEIERRLEDLKIWSRTGDRLATRVEFENYRDAVFFANAVFSLAEKEFHHPEVRVEYGAVSIDLWSHEADGITGKDFEMAEKIEETVSEIKWD
ncbi:MAG: 4a-hydroxytetrahydrobiopterin dehydratase [Candidatus Nanohaloarchaea archaeon]